MSNANLKIELTQRTDGNQRPYYVGKLKGDFTLNFKDGQAFLIFISEPGGEELQIAPMDKSKKHGNFEGE